MTASELGASPAFPVPPETIGPNGEICRPQYFGLTIRLYLAAAAMAGIESAETEEAHHKGPAELAERAVKDADALLERLAKET